MTSRSRAGFTLIEMMVSMTLTLLIMTIMAQAFVMALDTFSGLKGIGDMQQNLRTAAVLLRSDLGCDHFEGKRRLSDANLIRVGTGPQSGFFAVKQGSVVSSTPGSPYFNEGADLNGLSSWRANDHFLYFTAKRRGNRQENFFSTVVSSDTATLATFFGQTTAYNVPSNFLADVTLTPAYVSTDLQGTYSSQWSEILYFLERTGSTEDTTNPLSTLGNPIFSLYRAQFVMPTDSTSLNATAKISSAQISAFAGIACNPASGNVLTFYSPVDAANGNRSINPSTLIFPVDPTSASPDPQWARIKASSTLVLPNVISFHVQLMSVNNPNFGDLPGGALLYDTTKFNSAGANTFGLKAIQATMRIWDGKTRQTRQMSVIQEL